jgi:hypothetical protein
MNTTHTLSPTDVAMLRASLDTAERHSPVHEDDDPLSVAYGYWMGLYTTLAPPAVVIAAVGEILRLREENQLLKVGLAVRSQTLRSLAERTAVSVEGQ